MKTIETTWREFGRFPLQMGRMDINDVLRIAVDVSSCLRLYPDATFGVNVENAAGVKYPAENVKLENGLVLWTITSADTSVAGDGKAQVVMYGEDGEIDRSAQAQTIVLPSILPDANPPDVPPNWPDVANRLQGQIDKLAENAGGDVFIIHADGMRMPESAGGAFIGTLADKTPEEIRAAVADGKTCILVDAEGAMLPYVGEQGNGADPAEYPAFSRPVLIYTANDQRWQIITMLVKEGGEIETLFVKDVRMANPKPLVFTGAVSGQYDGSKAVVVDVPKGSGTGGSAEVEFASDDEFVTAMIENDLMIAVVDDTGVLADENNNIFEW